MTNETLPTPHSHLHAFNFHTGRPRFHFEEGGDAAAAAAASATAAAAAAAAAGAKPWHDGVTPEVRGFWQLKGLPMDDPKAFGTKLTELYQQAEKFIGAPPDQIVRIPKADAKPEDIRAYHERIGAPKEAKDYDLTAVKDQAIADALRATMYEKGVPKEAAAAIAATVAKAQESATTTQTTLDTGKLAEQKANLAKNWGGEGSPTYQFNHLQAVEGARRLGISPEAIAALETVKGFDGVMEAMRKIGAGTREDTFVERGVGGTGEVTTTEGAVARLAELMADTDGWAKRFSSGGVSEKREWQRLTQMISRVAA